MQRIREDSLSCLNPGYAYIFVESDRFKGTRYRAANWLRLGSTQGRTRNDRNHCLRATVKDVYLYPLNPDFRRELCA